MTKFFRVAALALPLTFAGFTMVGCNSGPKQAEEGEGDMTDDMSEFGADAADPDAGGGEAGGADAGAEAN